MRAQKPSSWAVALPLLVLWTAPATTQEPAQPAPAEREHVVRRGDTLWNLAAHYLSDPFLWRSIYETNRGVVEDPHWIFPDERLVIPGTPPGADPAAAAGPPAAPAAYAFAEEPTRTRFYPRSSTAVPTVLATQEALREPVSPEEIRSAPWLADPATLPVVGRLVSDVEGSISEGTGAGVHPFERVYLRYAGARPEIGAELLLVHVGRKVAGYGRVIEPVGMVEVTETAADVMTAVVEKQFDQIGPDVVAIPVPAVPELRGRVAEAVEQGAQGEIIGFPTPHPIYAPKAPVFITVGAAGGLQVGDELAAVLPARRSADGEALSLPAEVVARLQVVRVTEQSATARVIDLTQPVLEPGLPVRVTRRMP